MNKTFAFFLYLSLSPLHLSVCIEFWRRKKKQQQRSIKHALNEIDEVLRCNVHQTHDTGSRLVDFVCSFDSFVCRIISYRIASFHCPLNVKQCYTNNANSQLDGFEQKGKQMLLIQAKYNKPYVTVCLTIHSSWFLQQQQKCDNKEEKKTFW